MQKAEQLLIQSNYNVKQPFWRFRQFEVRQDGLVFWAYDKTYKTGERWVTWDEAIRLKNHRNWRNKNNPNKKQKWQEWYKKNKEYKDKQTRKWQKANKHHLSKYSTKRNKEQAEKNAVFALKQRLRKRTSKIFRLMGYTKKSKSNQILGCDWESLKKHIEGQFKNKMTWENKHLWHIDHIIPLASAQSEEELVALCHHSNLQPLWAKDNLVKAAKII
jgi:hypothetical protein